MMGALLLLALAAFAAAPEASFEPTLVEIEFRGLKTQSADSIRKLISAKEWAPYSQGDETADKETLENSGLFESVELKRTTLSASRFRLEIRVKESRGKKPGVLSRIFGRDTQQLALANAATSQLNEKPASPPTPVLNSPEPATEPAVPQEPDQEATAAQEAAMKSVSEDFDLGAQEVNDPDAAPSSYEPLISQSLEEARTPTPTEGAVKEPFLSRASPMLQSPPILDGYDSIFAPLKIGIDRLREKIKGREGLSERIIKERDRSAPDSALRIVSMQLLRVNQDFLEDALNDVENADEARRTAETLMLEGLGRHHDRLVLFRSALTRSAEEIYASTPVDPRPSFNDARKALNEAGETIERVRRAMEDASADLLRGRRAISEADRTISEAQRLNAESFSELLKEGPTIGELGEDLVALQREVLLETSRLQSMAQWQSVTREGDARQRARALRELAATHNAASALLENASTEWNLGNWDKTRDQISALRRALNEFAVAQTGLVKPLSNR